MQLCITRIWGRNEGSVAIEAALFFTTMLFSFVAFTDYSAVANSRLQLSAAVQMASNYALSEPAATTNLVSIMQHVSPGLSGVSATASQFCQCAGTTVACASSCGSGLQTYTALTASVSVPLLLSYPGLTNPFPLNESTNIRVQ